MIDLFGEVIKSRYVRKGVYAHQYRNGNINIDGKLYSGYGLCEAIAKFRKDYPLNKRA
jgi:hypothetical protein